MPPQIHILGYCYPSPVDAGFHNVDVQGGGDTAPQRVSKLSVVEPNGKNIELLLTSCRDW